jgi:hypothetical protein
MNAPAIALGDPKGILALPAAGIKNRADWTQADSDVLAHFIQVNQQIRGSRWHAAKNSFKIQGGQLLEAECPDLEQFVFAAVYFRQLFAKRDQLLKTAVDCYCKFVDCQIRPWWVRHEEQCFNGALDGAAWPLTGYTIREVFEAFLYGAGLLHRLPSENDDKRKRFLQLHDTEQPYRVLFALNGSLSTLGSSVSKLAVVIYRDYAHWQHTYGLPLPDVRWHDRLFNPFRVPPPAPSSPP